MRGDESFYEKQIWELVELYRYRLLASSKKVTHKNKNVGSVKPVSEGYAYKTGIDFNDIFSDCSYALLNKC